MPSSFDPNWFANAPAKLREATLPIPDALKPALRKKGDPEWTVRQLEDADIVRAEEERTNLVPKLIEQAASMKDKDAIEAMKMMLGISEDTPAGTRKKAFFLSACSIDPQVDRPQASKLLRTYPIFANELVNEIMRLTMLGAELGKPQSSTQVTKSEVS